MTPITLTQYGRTETIPAGQSKPFPTAAGSFYYIDEASHNSFTLCLNNGPTIKGKKTSGYKFTNGERIEHIAITNTHPTDALTITFTVGNGEPLDHFLNVLTATVTPTVRKENPTAFAAVEVECTGLTTPVQLVPLDCTRARIRIWTESAATAYWGPDDTPTWTNEAGNQVGLSLDGATTLETCAAVYVTGAAGVVVRAFVFTY